MGKRKNSVSHEYNDTATTLFVVLFSGACAFITMKIMFNDLLELTGHQASRLPGWQLDMGSLFMAFITFVVFVFVLAVFETRSRTIAWRSSAPWLPLAAFTALAAVIDIPLYIVLPVGILNGVWAYRRTCGVRRSPRSS